MNKSDFPIFKNNPNLIYLDSAATSLKPVSVIRKEEEYYVNYSANVFRGIYQLSEKATKEYEDTRDVVARFINSKRKEEVIFTKNTTESLNLVAYSLGRKIISRGDEIVTTIMEHHSNFVPWQELAFENGADFKVIDITNKYNLNLGISNGVNITDIDKIITDRTKIFALTYVSNVLGIINPVKEIIKAVKKINPKIIVIIDAAQAIPHMEINVQDLDCDFLAFSSHKMLGPTGVGVLFGKYEILSEMYPFNFGGEMIDQVSLTNTSFQKPPLKFEAGTPNIAGVIAFKEAIKYLTNIGMSKIREHEDKLVRYTLNKLNEFFDKEVKIIGPSNDISRVNAISFTYKNYHPHDIAEILDTENIAIRSGHHCTMPLHKRLGIDASARLSFYLYNDFQDIDKFIEGMFKVKKILK